MAVKKKSSIAEKYIEAVGRRKTATARVRITEAGRKNFTVNDKAIREYFKIEELSKIAQDPILNSNLKPKFDVSARVRGGGLHSQAEAVRHGLARALTLWDAELRGNLKKAGFLKRDPRMKERRKFGLKKARKAPQWSKR